MTKIGESKYWDMLWDHYKKAPSIALCRVPELEYASTLDVSSPFLDHCCGDGFFASIAWPNINIDVGCDISVNSIDSARKKKTYKKLEVCDVSKEISYPDKTFNLIFNNSALEHILDLDHALFEVSRVLDKKGVFAFNVLNHRYFQWWPLSEKAKKDYRIWQPFYHAFSLKEWEQRLNKAGMELVSVDGYFDRKSSAILAKLDYYFSGYYIRKKISPFIVKYFLFNRVQQVLWKRKLAELTWKTEPDSGSGYFIKAKKK